MAKSTRNLWPDDIGISSLRAPVTILREQAGFLSDKTLHIVEGAVRTKTSDENKFLHTFYLEAPALDRYRFYLFSIEHDTNFYPLNILSEEGQSIVAKSEDDFTTQLADLFASEKTKKVIHALIAQSQT
ncbi:MAG: hypothetical protein ABFS56_34690 [Pseudomonadota bacterium]